MLHTNAEELECKLLGLVFISGTSDGKRNGLGGLRPPPATAHPFLGPVSDRSSASQQQSWGCIRIKRANINDLGVIIGCPSIVSVCQKLCRPAALIASVLIYMCGPVVKSNSGDMRLIASPELRGVVFMACRIGKIHSPASFFFIKFLFSDARKSACLVCFCVLNA